MEAVRILMKELLKVKIIINSNYYCALCEGSVIIKKAFSILNIS